MKKIMNIILDNIIFSGQKAGGISVVWYELLRRLVKEDNLQLWYIDNPNCNNPYRKKLNIEERFINEFNYSCWSGLFPVLVKEDGPFIFHSSYYRYCNNPNAINITTVHDFTYEYYRKGLAKWKHCWQKYQAIRHSQYIVCISENTKKDLLKFLPEIDEKKVRVIYNGVSEDYFVIPKQKHLKNIPFEPFSYVVFVGSRAGYKNFELVKRCVAQSKYNIVIVGTKPDEIEDGRLKKCISQDKYFCTGFLSNEQLNVVYNHAAALVYPSLYEGFGIPVIEAQRTGCPVIAYNGSSIPEVIGDTPLLMNELSEKELLSKLNMLSNTGLIDQIRLLGLENSKRFSWDKMYNEYLHLYQEAFCKVQHV